MVLGSPGGAELVIVCFVWVCGGWEANTTTISSEKFTYHMHKGWKPPVTKTPTLMRLHGLKPRCTEVLQETTRQEGLKP